VANPLPNPWHADAHDGVDVGTTDPDFERPYDRARQAMGDALAEQILEIADDASTDLSDPQSVNRAQPRSRPRKAESISASPSATRRGG
jgi:hypothetical protein